MKKLIIILAVIGCLSFIIDKQYFDAPNTEIVGIVEDSTSNPIDFIALDTAGHFRTISKDSITTATRLNDTLASYYTRTQVDEIANDIYQHIIDTLDYYYTKQQVNDTLDFYELSPE